MAKKLFSSFETSSKSEWKAKIISDLKGKDYNDTLQWKTEEGIVVEPIYHSEDLKELLEKYDNLGVSNITSEEHNWKVVEKIRVNDIIETNKAALLALKNGAEAIEFDLQTKTLTEEIVNSLTDNILLDIAPVNITNFSGGLDFKYLEHINFDIDSITRKLANSEVFLESDFKGWHDTLKSKKIKSFYIDGAVYQNAGAKIIEQLAFILAIGNEYLNKLSEQEIAELDSLRIKIAIGSNFFFEIAKLRALRKILKVLLAQYNGQNCRLRIHAESTITNKSETDVNSNMLRNTSECMSAIIGGVDSICINAHDSLKEDSEKGRRWARNITHILRNESYFHKVNDPTKGAYYIEELTDQLANESWELFKSIEERGGFLKNWESDDIQSRIKL